MEKLLILLVTPRLFNVNMTSTENLAVKLFLEFQNHFFRTPIQLKWACWNFSENYLKIQKHFESEFVLKTIKVLSNSCLNLELS